MTRERKVNQLSMDGTLIKEWDKITDAAKETGTNYSCITLCCRGFHKSSNGFKWEYNNKDFVLPKDPLDNLLFIEDDEDDEIILSYEI